MREAIGGTWLTGIVITFIVIFSGFLVYSINYTKAFRAKNEIINIIEKNEGFTTTKQNLNNITSTQLEQDKTTQALIFKFIKSLGYSTSNDISCPSGSTAFDGYCLAKHTNDSNSRSYYTVTTYIRLSIPVLDIGVKIPITGQTKTMYYDKGNWKG